MANKKARKAKKKDPLDEIFEMHFKRDDEIKKNYLKVRGLPMMDSEVFLTQAAEILGYSRQLLQKAMRKKLLPFRRVSRYYLIRGSDLWVFSKCYEWRIGKSRSLRLS